MAQQRRSGRSGILALALLSTLAACSGGSSGSGDSPGSNDQPAAIQGVATPSNVAVVTATNAS